MLLHQKSVAIAICALCIGPYGCSSDNDNLPGTDNELEETSQLAPGETPGEESTLEGLAGSWQRVTCLASATDASVYTTASLAIADNVATLTTASFTDNACTTVDTPTITVTDSSLVFDDNTSTTTLGEASHVDSTIESKTVDGTSSTDGVNEISYDIALIINDTLYFGDTQGSNDGSSATLRPTELDEQFIFTRDGSN